MWQNFFFQIAMAGAGGIRAMGWNPSDKTGQVTLSGDASRIASVTRSAPFVNQSVRGLTGRSTGKRYFEVTLTTLIPGSIALGIADNTVFSDTFFFGEANSFGAIFLGNYVNSTTVASTSLVAQTNAESIAIADAAAPIQGSVVGFACDLDLHHMWVSKNGVWLNGDPNTPTGELDWGDIWGVAVPTMYPLLQSAGTGTLSVTLNMGDEDFIHPLPTDYVAWGKRE